MNKFNVFNINLSGKNLIEASAGTGKTYSIALLFLRFILNGLELKEILAVTFTIAATAELKDRIRTFLKEALYILSGKEVENSDIRLIIDRQKEDKEILFQRANKALFEFDEACIFTIHGFCQRVIYEHAFECSSFFEGKPAGEEKDLIEEAVCDFWRTHFYNAPEDFLEYAMVEKNITPPYFIKIAGNNFNKPHLLTEPWPELSMFGPDTEGNDKTSLYENDILILKHKVLTFVKERLDKFKREESCLSYDDLLLILYYTLKSERGVFLKERLQKKYKAVFIDEFQDTDPVQYEIFQTLFEDSSVTVFYTGDPKQAIYSFRNADIFAYLKAAEHIKSSKQFTMDINYRAKSSLVEATEKVFTLRKNPFLYSEIDFPQVKGRKESTETLLTEKGNTFPPLNIWYLRADKVDKKYISGKGKYKFTLLTVTSAVEFIIKGMSFEILRLLDRKEEVKIGENYLKPSDIAVLTRTNREALMVKEVLGKYNVPSVVYNTESVFHTDEAIEMATVLRAVSEYNDEKAVRGALITDIFGYGLSYIDKLSRDEKEWEKWIDTFRNYHILWKKSGFLRMFGKMVKDNDIKKKLLSSSRGERKITNALHIAELIHREEFTKKLAPSDTLKYVLEKISEVDTESEDYELRIESDKNAVIIITVHKSKGLEFPVVFCPFLWHSSKVYKKDDPLLYHNKDKLPVLNLAGEEEAVKKANEENLAENLRIMYVALTRAVCRCYLFWGRINGAGTSAPAYIFHNCRDDNSFKDSDDGTMYGELLKLNDNKTISVTEIPPGKEGVYEEEKKETELDSAKEFTGMIDKNWSITSYSGLVFTSGKSVDEPDRDFYEDTVITERSDFLTDDSGRQEESGTFDFPRGRKTGMVFHEIFEKLDFQGNNIKKTVAEVLDKYHMGKDNKTGNLLYNDGEKMVRNVISASLSDGKEGFCLKDISEKDLIKEFEFYFPLAGVNTGKIKSMLNYDTGYIPFKDIEGYLHGYIDLICRHKCKYYIIDWKTLYLGSCCKYYSPVYLKEAIKEHNYRLQYLLYTVALNRYLLKRDKNYDYEKNFGGIFYIFLRGVSGRGGDEYGKWFDRPDMKVINKLSDYLID